MRAAAWGHLQPRLLLLDEAPLLCCRVQMLAGADAVPLGCDALAGGRLPAYRHWTAKPVQTCRSHAEAAAAWLGDRAAQKGLACCGAAYTHASARGLQLLLEAQHLHGGRAKSALAAMRCWPATALAASAACQGKAPCQWDLQLEYAGCSAHEQQAGWARKLLHAAMHLIAGQQANRRMVMPEQAGMCLHLA